MTVQTYCSVSHVQHLLSDRGVTYRADDDQSGVVASSGTEADAVANCIEMAAADMNVILQNFSLYDLDDLAGNEWCRWANAAKAAMLLCERRGNSPPNSVIQRAQQYDGYLQEIKAGRVTTIPGSVPSHDARPMMTNFTVEPARGAQPIRRQPNISTGAEPDGTTKSWPVYPGYYDYYI